MTYHYITYSDAAPFFSDTSSGFIDADTPIIALRELVKKYNHPTGLYSAMIEECKPNPKMLAQYYVLPSPAEDGSYGTNGDGVFGFTPEDIYIEHNMLYVVATVPLSFQKAVQRLTIIDIATEAKLKELMDKINVK